MMELLKPKARTFLNLYSLFGLFAISYKKYGPKVIDYEHLLKFESVLNI
jgi:hypothetical protein